MIQYLPTYGHCCEQLFPKISEIPSFEGDIERDMCTVHSQWCSFRDFFVEMFVVRFQINPLYET